MPAISDLGFTSHNILLPDGRETLPGRPLLAMDPACRALLRTVRRLVPPGGKPPRVVDLGCLEGGYAVEFARAGYDVLGIEVRTRNFERSEAVARELDLPNLRFVRDDARNIEAYGEFDIVLCLGLLYHLDRPATFLGTLSTLTRRLLLLNTHYATRDGECKHHALSPLTTHDGRKGRWFEEYPDGISDDALEEAAWASFGNPKSFWLEKAALLSTLVDSGFSTVFEEFDFMSPLEENYPIAIEHQRGLFVGLK